MRKFYITVKKKNNVSNRNAELLDLPTPHEGDAMRGSEEEVPFGEETYC